MWTYLWQNFLTDSKVRSYIADKVSKLFDSTNSKCLIEIWPGKWAITKLIDQVSPIFLLIEKDPYLAQKLKEKKENSELNFTEIINQDVLEVDIQSILSQYLVERAQTIVVWNLPYYITSPILTKFFWLWKQDFAWWIFMIQEEVWQKIHSLATKKSYLRRILNFAYEVKYLKQIWPKSFSPPPKVKSCLVSLTPSLQMPDVDFWDFMEFIDIYSPFSRKTLNAIQKITTKQNKKNYNIPENLLSKRLEQLNLDDIKQILAIRT